MKDLPLRTTVIGSYPFPGWLEFACGSPYAAYTARPDAVIPTATPIRAT